MMKKIIQKITPFVIVLTLMITVLTLSQDVQAQFTTLEAIGKDSGLPTEKDFIPRGNYAGSDEGINRLEGLLLTIVDLVKYAIYTIAVFLAVFQGFKLVVAGKDIDTFSGEAGKNVKYSLMAILIVFVADQAIRKVFFPESGAVFENNGANLELYGKEGIAQIRSLYNIMAFVAGALALVVIILSGVGMALSSGNEETFKKHQNRILWALGGLLLVGVAEFVIKDVIFPDFGTKLPNISKGLLLVKKFTNFMSGFIATISLVIILYGGYLYVLGGVNEDNLGKAKKAFTAGVVGILLSAGAFGIVSTLIKVEPGGGTIAAPIGQAPPGLEQIALPKK